MRINFSILLLFLACIIFARADGDVKKKASLDIDALRREISKPTEPSIRKEKSPEKLNEVGSVRDSILKSSPSLEFSEQLSKALKDITSVIKKENVSSAVLGLQAQEAIEHPDINVIDNHVQEIISNDTSSRNLPDIDEIRKVSRDRMKNSDVHNLYRENLRIKSIREEVNFIIGNDVDQWKTIAVGEQTALFGLTPHSITVALGSNGTFDVITQIEIEAPKDKMSIEIMKIWDANMNKLRIVLLLGVSKDLIWYELNDSKLIEIRKSRLLKDIDKVSYFQHDGSDLIMLTTVDDQQRIEVEFYEFNLSTEDLWLVQAFKLPIRPVSMVCIDAGRDFIIAFTQDSHVSIYRHQHTKFERGKFSFMKKIDAGRNVSVISGFRIGGHTYLAIGGDQPHIYRYVNGDFQSQAILSQTFGHVEEFLPIPIQIYRDDLVLLVQHRIDFGTHSLVAVDALIWNGIAFENSLSVPCHIVAMPNANGFSCTLDPRRDEGLRGSTFIVENQMGAFHIIVPRDQVHSGLFRIKYEIKEAEDPLITQMEQIKNSIQLINGMLDFEASLKLEIDDFFAKSPYNPDNNFEFENLMLDEIETDILQHIEKVTLESARIEFLNNMSFDKEDMLALELLESMEKTLEQDEERIRQLDAEINKLIRVNRQTHQPNSERTPSSNPPDSPIIQLGPYNFNGQINSQTLRVNPLIRNRRRVESFREARVTGFKSNNMDVETINGIPFTDFVFLQNGELSLPNNDIIFESSIQVKGDVNLINEGKVNGIDISREILAIDSPNTLPDTLRFETIGVENLIVQSINDLPVNSSALNNLNVSFEDNLPIIKTQRAVMKDNLNVETINGVKWNEFVSKLIFKREPSEIEKLTVNGNLLIAGERAEIIALNINKMKFPQEFVLKRGPSETVIKGKKIFTNTLTTNEIDTDGNINGINPFEMITLDKPQQIDTETTFNVMEVIKKLEVNGTISGQKLDEFLPNPTLELTKEILASCTFRDLTVEGDLTVENSFNGINLEKALSDAVYDTGETVVVNAKVFTNLDIKENANISSNFINDVNLKDIMTTNTEQEVMIEKLQGDVHITNLRLGGLYDGINPTQLEANSIRTFGNQFIESPLIIAENGIVGANSLEIKTSLNEIPVENFLFTDQSIAFPGNVRVEFLDLTADNLKAGGDIIGTGALRYLNLQDFANNRMSKSLKQVINVPVEIGTLTTRNTFDGATINGQAFEKFKGYMKKMKDFSKSLLSGEHKIDTLIVNGSASINFINDRDMRALADAVIWLDRRNVFDEIVFLDDIYVKNLSLRSTVNGRDYNLFVENWVSKTENPVTIRADITFEKEVVITENLVTQKINNIKYEDFLRKDDIIEVDHLNIAGSVIANKLTVKNSFNERPQKEFNDLYSYDKESYYHIVHADVKFHQPSKVAYLNTPELNGRNVAKWLESLIKVYDSNVVIEGAKIFKNDLLAEKGILIDTLNGHYMKDIIKNIVTINNNVIIYGDLIFVDDVYADIVALRNNLTTDNVNGCSLKEWMLYTLHTDKNIKSEGEIRMHGEEFRAKYLTVGTINGIPFKDILTLKTDQVIDYLKIEGDVSVTTPLKVKHFFTNGVNEKKIIDLRMERDNSVMVHDKNVSIDTPLIFLKEARVLDSITSKGHINSKRIENIALLNSSPTFDSKMVFKSLEAHSINSDDHISGLDFNRWYNSRVWKRSNEVQVITNDWSIKQANIHEDCTGNGLINGRSINQIQKNLKDNVNQVQTFLSNYTGQYGELCKKLQSQVEDYGHSSVHILKYLELDFKIVDDRDIYSFYDFSNKQDHYLIVNSGCASKVYLWMKSKQKYMETAVIETGIIYDYAIVENSNGDFFVITNSKVPSDAPCKFNGLNSWKLVDHNLVHITTIKTDGAVNKILSHPSHSRKFYALDSTDKVISCDAFGTKLEEWKLPTESLSYSFLPYEILPDLNLYNGKRIFSLESKRRFKRTFWNQEDRSTSKNVTKPSKFVLNPPDYSMPVIEPITWPQFADSAREKNANLLQKMRSAGDMIKSSLGLKGKVINKNEKSSDEEPKENEPVRDKTKILDKPTGLLFTIRNPDFPKIKDIFEKHEAPTKINVLKPIGQSINDAMNNPNLFLSTSTAIPENEEYHQESETTDVTVEDESPDERQAESTVIQANGVRDMENSFIPEHSEIIVIHVGPADQKKQLFAVSKKRNSVVVSSGDRGNDFIEVYSDIVEGRVFQYIQCKNPSDITALHFRDETLLAFMESRREVQILIYRGIQGFVFFNSIRLDGSAHHMSAITVPPKLPYKCNNHYLVIQFSNELHFMKVKIDGNCGLSHVECDGN